MRPFGLDACTQRTTFWAKMLVRPTGYDTVPYHELFSAVVAVVDLTCVHDALATLVTEWTRVFMHGRWRSVFRVALFAFSVANVG